MIAVPILVMCLCVFCVCLSLYVYEFCPLFVTVITLTNHVIVSSLLVIDNPANCDTIDLNLLY